MKNKDDAPEKSQSEEEIRKSSPNGSSSHLDFLEQERLCKELYLSLHGGRGVPDNTDDDVDSIIEQMSQLHPQGLPPIGDRNIDDIIQEAEFLIDKKSARKLHTDSDGSSFTLTAGQSDFDSSKSQSNESTLHDENLPQVRGTGSEKFVNELADQTSLGTPLDITYKKINEEIRGDVEKALASQFIGDFPDLRLKLSIPGLETPSCDMPGCFNLESEFLEERKRCLKLKADLDWLRKQHLLEIAELRKRHEGQLLQIKEELSSQHAKSSRVMDLEKELNEQDKVIAGYQRENEKISTELKAIKRALLRLMVLLKSDSEHH